MQERPLQWEAEARLVAAGYRITRQRRAVLAALGGTQVCLTANEVYDAARCACPSMGLATVYRTLEALIDVGAVRRVHGHEKCEAYVAALGSQGCSVVCTRCGRVREVADYDLRGVADAAAAETGYVIADHFLQLSGVCGACRGLAGGVPPEGRRASAGARR